MKICPGTRPLLVGAQGMSLADFLARPAKEWVGKY